MGSPLQRLVNARRAGAAVLVAVALLLLPAAAASAHVSVIPDASSTDGFAKLTFRVPNESATAGTVKVEVTFPTDTPFIAVTYLPVSGWTAEVVEAELPVPVEVSGATLTQAPASVVWTADPGVQIAPGAFEEFSVVAGPLPDPGTEIVLPATQTYSDGDVVRWHEVAAEGAAEGAAEPAWPAPVLVTPVSAGDAATDAATGTATDDTAADTAADPVARGLGGLGLLLGAGALVVVLWRRRPAPR